MTVRIAVAVEGMLDEAVLRRLTALAGIQLGAVYGRNGKDALRRNIRGYNNAARFSPWVVLVDLNHEQDCPPALLAAWLPDPAQQMSLRVAVRKVESWLLADRPGMARFLGVSRALLPARPDLEDDSKLTLVNLARRARFASLRRELVPTPEGGRQVGPAYTSRMTDFVYQIWDPQRAADASPSLAHCLAAFQHLAVIHVKPPRP